MPFQKVINVAFIIFKSTINYIYAVKEDVVRVVPIITEPPPPTKPPASVERVIPIVVAHPAPPEDTGKVNAEGSSRPVSRQRRLVPSRPGSRNGPACSRSRH